MARPKYTLAQPRRRRRGAGRTLLLLGLFLVGAALGLGVVRGASSPVIALELSGETIGPEGHVKATFVEPDRGLAEIRLELIQGPLQQVLCAQTFAPRPVYALGGEATHSHSCEADIGQRAVAALKQGALELRATAGRAGGWLSHPDPVVERRALQVKLTPPRIAPTSERIYVRQGGAEAVVYRVSADAVRHGVEVGGWFFPGFPLPGGKPDEAFALFAVPYEVGDLKELRLVAEDALGNRAARGDFVHQFFPRPPTTDTIALSPALMRKITEAVLPRTPALQDKGDLLQNYLQINGPLREQNRARLRTLAAETDPRFLWREPFLPMKNAAVMGRFDDRRTYTYDGATVDQQTHLGIDFASVAQAPVQAANPGKVLWADDLGIYGNCVVIDHGYGLATLYGHLSDVAVQRGQEVERGQQIGRSGATGMAGGDHLHFAVLLQGLPIDPAEWLDANWLHDRLKLKLGDALPFTGG